MQHKMKLEGKMFKQVVSIKDVRIIVTRRKDIALEVGVQILKATLMSGYLQDNGKKSTAKSKLKIFMLMVNIFSSTDGMDE